MSKLFSRNRTHCRSYSISNNSHFLVFTSYITSFTTKQHSRKYGFSSHFIPLLSHARSFQLLVSPPSMECSQNNPPWPYRQNGKTHDKLTRLHFYFHDTLDDTNPTAIRIAGPSKRSFGTTMMIDDPLTEGPETSSKLVGRAQGIYAFASQRDSGLLLMVMNFAFLEGTYYGSARSILGHNPTLDKVREMPIVGGSGFFCYARGYALAKTFSFNQKTGDAVVEYSVCLTLLRVACSSVISII